MEFELSFLGRLDIGHEPEGLTEPSGLALSRDGTALWTVSDDTRTVFKLDLEGRLVRGESFRVDLAGLEGISLDETGDYLYVVQEEENRLIKYSLRSKEPVWSRRLSELEGYEEVGRHFTSGDKNKGLEGVTVDTRTGSLFLLKEGKPALLLEVAPDATRLTGYHEITDRRGFTDDDLEASAIDCSGICFDSTRSALWIISDKARRIYLYSRDRDEVLFDTALRYPDDMGNRTIRKAEGVAHDALRDRLYIVSDEEARLYLYAIR